MKLHTLKPAEGSIKVKKRLGRGVASGMGGTSTRGHKGAKSRSGYSSKSGFEGGQMPLQRRVPKFGFTPPNRVEFKALNLGEIETLAAKLGTKELTIEMMVNNGVVGKTAKVKVLSRGEIKSKIDVQAHAFSKAAIAAIEKAGGKATKL